LKNKMLCKATLLVFLATLSVIAHILYTSKTHNSVDELLVEALLATNDDVQKQALLSASKTLEKLEIDIQTLNTTNGCRVVGKLVELLEESIKVYIEELKRYSDIAENLDNLALMVSYNLKRYSGTLTAQIGSSGEVAVTVARDSVEEIIAALKLINATAATKAVYVEMLRVKAEEIAKLAQTLASLYTYCEKS